MSEQNNALNPQGDLVVGVDGTVESFAALRWALNQAVLSGQSVNAVYGWSYSWDMGPEPQTEQEVDELLDAMFSPPPEPGEELPAPERTAPEQDKDEFLEAVLGASPTREEGQTENPTEGRIEKSRQSEPTSKPKEPTAPGTSDPQERSRPSVRQELKEITAEQREKAAKGKEQSKPTKGPKHKAPRKYKPKRLKER